MIRPRFSAGANTLNGISFSASDTSEAKAEALREAVADAKNKADVLAEASGLKITGIESLSGMGLMIGIKTTAPAGDVVRECMNRGVLCLTAKDKVRLLPALNIPMEDLEYAIETIKAVAAELGGNV